MKPVKIFTRTTSMDYGQFYLLDDYLNDDFLDRGGEPTERENLIPLAHENNGIASDNQEIVIISPVACNFNMKIQVELWEEKPPSDISDWQEVFQSYIKLTSNVLIYSDVLYDHECRFDVPSGRYSLLISGRGFDVLDEKKSQDEWRIQIWQSTEVATHKKLKSLS